MTNVFLSVVIISYNKLDYLRAVLKNLENQTDFTSVEVIVVNDGSTDETDDFLRNIQTKFTLIYISIPNSGSAVARNTGIKIATGTNILFVDNDIILEPNYLKKLKASILENPDRIHSGSLRLIPISVVPRIIKQLDRNHKIKDKLLIENSYLDAIYGALPAACENSNSDDLSCWWALVTGGNICFPRLVIEEIGLFDESFKEWGPEDIDLTYRAFKKDFKLKFNSNCTLYHLDHTRDRNEIQRSMAKNVASLLKKYRKHKEILAYVNFFNGVISLDFFNAICEESLNVRTGVQLAQYYVSLNYYIEKDQMINWKKNGNN